MPAKALKRSRATFPLLLALSTTTSALPLAGNTPGVLSFGVGNNPIGGISRLSGMPVGYRYQYFTGGLGGNDWRNWNSPDGAFADLWLKESRDAGLTPVVTYYNLVPATPYAYEDPPFRNLQTAATMKAYFENWIFLLQRIKAYGDPVVVHLEPDLFGYFQWNDSDPANTAVAVASSGLPQAIGYENNARGYAKLMAALRDQYAPNVVLGWHASAWATRTDLILNQGDPEAIGLATANFYRALGTAFDVMFSEFSDRDSGYYQVNGQAQRWWKPEDFDRYRRFIAKLSSELGQEVILWQIPVGNTLYRSGNNTTGHYQDNRAEYFLQSVLEGGDTTHLEQYRDAGVVAFLFGAGQDEQTRYFDALEDGVTNPPAIDNRTYNHTDHLNDRTALNADDDGGFLRAGIGEYYANGALALNRGFVACNDGVDNDGDGATDYPADPGCVSASDGDETDPLPVPAVCADGLDNDGDGLTDYPADPGCASATDADESNPPLPTELPASLRITGDWGSGYCADVAVTNGTAAGVVWKTTFTAQGPIQNLWSATYTQNGKQVEAQGAEWNTTLAAGATANFGFCAERTSVTPVCSDGLDNDGDGLADYPDDSGCNSPTDTDETDPIPGSVSAALSIDSDWGSGYCATVDVRNSGPTSELWRISLAIEGQVDNLWNAVYTQAGPTLNAAGADWNKSLPAGGSTQFGYCAQR
ncbi:cellulose binding domain-containing protein [Methylococcus sp. EFPC2]|uniref:cellulose binding domain-containing protein n=1 Tax=Methylococcus sp. EFPC2 TaxID=2812648 RepID=UPI0019682680|nr:cellulose binding domain-containing protein [Methylococcus sp. EFPC2]QSA96502.1 cellulose binding domain-containing protein [Methylococcus sp. EFPC2]